MARTVDQIKKFIYDQMATKPSLALILSNPSDTCIWKDFVHCVAVEMAVHEQLIDEFEARNKEYIAAAPVSTTAWIRQKAFEFQYSSTVPQIIQVVNFIPSYNPVNPALRIIKVCCIRFSTSRIVNIIVAKNYPPVALTAPELTAIQGYFTDGGSSTDFGTGIGVAGIAHNLISLSPDQMYMKATIYYSGQYSANIKADVIAAIEKHIAELGARGILNVQKLTDAIQAVTGVNDILIEDLAIRSNGTLFPSKTFLIQSFAQILKEKEAASGYAIGETDASNTLLDKLTFTVG